MFFLNLSPAEFLLLFSAVSGVAVALYLLDRSKRRQTVATLRFWHTAEQPVVVKHRRRIQQPWSLLLQVLGMALLLLAIAQLRLGSRDGIAPEHILIVDTSSWMGSRSHVKGSRILLDDARRVAHRWLDALPASDRVMVVRADALTTPATGLEADRKALADAIDRSRPGPTALDIGQAIEFARQFQKLHSKRPGEIVFAGAGRILAGETPPDLAKLANLRVLPVSQTAGNAGLRRIGLRRSSTEGNLWEVFVSVRNYSDKPRGVPLVVRYGGAPIGTRQLALPPFGEENVSFQFRTKAAGWIEARLLGSDDFAEDDRAILELPAQRTLKVTVYSNEPELLRPVLEANPRVQATFLPPAAYRGQSDAQIVIFDRFGPPKLPDQQAIWVDPPRASSPIPVRAVQEKARLEHWRSDHPLGAGLHSKGLEIESAEVYEAAPGDIALAEAQAGPVILARPGKFKQVVIGFHPMHGAFRFDLVTPLLFANILRWMEPDIFRTWELNAGSVGSVYAKLDADIDPARVKVVNEHEQALPFGIRNRSLHFFSGEPGTFRVLTGDREMVYSLTLPEVAEKVWTPPAAALRGIPRRGVTAAASRDLWQWLALTGLAALLAEWILYGRGQTVFRPAAARAGLWSRNPRAFRKAS